MKIYNVSITEKALADMDDIYNYIADVLIAPEAAASQYNRIADAILSLDFMPMRIQLMNSEPERTKGLRALIVDKYSVIFTVRGDDVYVVRVFYSAMDISARLAINDI